MIKKIAYSIGAVATALSYQSFSAYIIFFYVDVIKLNAGLAALAMSVFGVWNALNDPIAGFISDRWRTKWGRRIPYIALCAVPLGLVYYFLWTPPYDASHMGLLFAYFLLLICLFDGVYTVVILNWASLFPEMYPSLDERAQVNSLRQSFGMLGLVLGVALPPLIYSTLGWRAMGLIFGALITAVILATLFGSSEKREFTLDRPLKLKDAVVKTFSSRSFMIFVMANLFIQYVFTMILAVVPFYAKYVLNIGPYGTSAMLLTTFITAIVMMFAWRYLAVALGAKTGYMLSIAVLALSLIPFLSVTGYWSALLSTSLVGVGLAGVILISDILISDVIDEDELCSGSRREGMFFGFNAFITRFAIALEAASLGIVFVAARYNPYVFHQTASFLSGLRMLLSGLPILALIAAFVIMRYYPLSGGRLKEMRRELADLHKLKEEKRRLEDGY